MAARRGYVGPAGRQIHFTEAGEGPPLVVLHSAPRSARSCRLMLEALEPNFRTIAPDLPGFGSSDPLPGPVTMEALAEAMVTLLDGLNLPHAHVFGYHTGNKVAAALAAHHSARVDRLMLCGQIHSIIPDREARNDAIRLIVEKYFTRYPESASGEGHLRRWQADWSDICALAQPRALFARDPVCAADIEALKIRVLDHVQGLSAVAATYQANFEFDFAATLALIRQPTLIIELVTADEEHYGRQLDVLCSMLARGRGVTVMDAGKVALESHTQELTKHIRDFTSAAA